MKHLTAAEARAFAEQWLPAWTGNDPERLASFYSDDTFYLDPAIPAGELLARIAGARAGDAGARSGK